MTFSWLVIESVLADSASIFLRYEFSAAAVILFARNIEPNKYFSCVFKMASYSDLLAVPSKKAYFVEVSKPLKDLIDSIFVPTGLGSHVQYLAMAPSISEALDEFQKLRQVIHNYKGTLTIINCLLFSALWKANAMNWR